MAQITKNINQIPDLSKADYSSDKAGSKPSGHAQSSSSQDFSNILQRLRSSVIQPDQSGLFDNKKRAVSNNLQDNLIKTFQLSSFQEQLPSNTEPRINSFDSSDLSKLDEQTDIDLAKKDLAKFDKISESSDSPKDEGKALERNIIKSDNSLADKQNINDKALDKALNDKLSLSAAKDSQIDNNKLSAKLVNVETINPALKGEEQPLVTVAKDAAITPQVALDKAAQPKVQIDTNLALGTDKSMVDQELAKLVAAGLVDAKSSGLQLAQGSVDKQAKSGVLATSSQLLQVNSKDGSKTLILPNNILGQTEASKRSTAVNLQSNSAKTEVQASQKNVIDTSQPTNSKQPSSNALSTNLDQTSKNSNIDLTGLDKTNEKINLNLNKLTQLEGVKSTKVTNIDQANSNLKGDIQLSDKQSSNLILAQAQPQNQLKTQEFSQSQSTLAAKDQASLETKPSLQESSAGNNKQPLAQESLSEKVASKIVGEKQSPSVVNLATIKASENLLQNQKSVQKQQSNSQIALNTIDGMKAKTTSLPQDSRGFSNNQDKSALDKSLARLGKEPTTDGKKTSSTETNFAQTLSTSLTSRSSSSNLALIRTVQQQIVQAAKSQNSQSAQKIEIALNPSKLGKLDLKLEFEKSGALKLVIITDKAETLEMLSRDQSLLIKSLQEDGIDLQKEALSFQYSGEQQENQQANQQDNQQGNNNQDKKQTNQQQSQANLNTEDQPNQYLDDGSIDIKV